MKTTRVKSILSAVLAGLLVGLVALLLTDLAPFRTLELKWTDMMFETRGELSVADSPIVLVAVSEQSDFELPVKFPYPTEYYARLIHNLNEAGAAVIALDIVFDKEDIYNPGNDSLFADAIRQYGNVILAGDVRREVQRASHAELRSAFDGQQLVQPIRLLRQANPNEWGFVAVNRDRDGYLRRYPLSVQHFDKTYYSFALEILRYYEAIPESEMYFTGDGFQLGSRTIPRWDNRNFHINYVGYPGSFPEFNFSDVLDTEDFFTTIEDEDFQINAFDDPEFGLLHQDVFRDKIVLVGSTMPELHDFYPTPFAPNGNMPGYESHANALQTILYENFITRPSIRITTLMIFFAGLLVVGLTVATPVRLGAFVWVLLVGGYLLVVYNLFAQHNIIIEMVGPVMALLIGYISAVVYSYFAEEKEKRRIRQMFGSYVAPEVVDRIIASGQQPRLGGEKAHITAFFSDIQGFSAFSEKLTPEELVELMNEYLTAMTDILIDEGGTLDKYIGDAIVAIFGAPVKIENHALFACRTALKMIQRQASLREKWRSEGDKWPTIVHFMQTRIGLNTGDVITGNMGSKKRLNYTMMGDDVNLAARCESGAKSYGVYVMVTNATRLEAEAADDSCVFRELDKIVVKGRSKPVLMNEIVAFRDELTENDKQCLSHYDAGLNSYYGQNWDAAEESFRISAKFERYMPDKEKGIASNPSLVMIERIGNMRENPPGADWDGVYVMTNK